MNLRVRIKDVMMRAEAIGVLEATISIIGSRPFYMHRFGPDAIPLQKQERTGVAGNDPEEWKRTVLALPDGRLYVPPTYVFGCIRDGAKFTKKGRGSIQAMVVATVQVKEHVILFNEDLVLPSPEAMTQDPAQRVYLDVASVRNPQTRARNVRYRVALAPGWSLTFHLQWDPSIVSRTQLEAAAIDAGHLCGIGDGRAIGAGRFEVESFDVRTD